MEHCHEMGSGFKVLYKDEKIFKKKFCHEDLQNNSQLPLP